MVLFKLMRDKFHKTVLPNDENKGIPLLIQASGAVVVMLLGFAIFAFANFHGYIVNNYAGENYAAVVAAVLIDQTNDEREDEQLPELQPSELLTASAQLKADDMPMYHLMVCHHGIGSNKRATDLVLLVRI